MGRTGVLQEIRMLRFEEIHDRFTKGRLSAAEAAEWLGVSERTFRRQRARFEEEGVPAGATHEGLRTYSQDDHPRLRGYSSTVSPPDDWANP